MKSMILSLILWLAGCASPGTTAPDAASDMTDAQDDSVPAETASGDFYVTLSPPPAPIFPGQLVVLNVNTPGVTPTFALEGLPADWQAEFAPSLSAKAATNGTGGTVLRLHVPWTAPVANYPLTVHATTALFAHTATTSVSIQAPWQVDFSVQAADSFADVQAGGETLVPLQVTPIGAFSGLVTLVLNNDDSPRPVFDPPVVTLTPGVAATTTLHLRADAGAPLGQGVPATVTAVSGRVVHALAAQVNASVVAAPSPALSAPVTPRELWLVPGGPVVAASVQPGFSDPTGTHHPTVVASGAPPGVTVTATGSALVSESMLSATADATAVPGSYDVTLTTSDGALTATSQLHVVVLDPNPSWPLLGAAALTTPTGLGPPGLTSGRVALAAAASGDVTACWGTVTCQLWHANAWHAAPSPAAAPMPAVLYDAQDTLVLGLRTGVGPSATLLVNIGSIPGPLAKLPASASPGRPNVAVDQAGAPMLAASMMLMEPATPAPAPGLVPQVLRYSQGQWTPALAGWSPLVDPATVDPVLLSPAAGPLLVTLENGHIAARRWTGSAWSDVGSPGPEAQVVPSAQRGVGEQLAAGADAKGNPLVAWIGSDEQLHVATFAGAWTVLPPLQPEPGTLFFHVALVADGQGRPIIATQQATAATGLLPADSDAFRPIAAPSHVHVARWDGTVWADVGLLNRDSRGHAFYPALTVTANGAPIAAWIEDDHVVVAQPAP